MLNKICKSTFKIKKLKLNTLDCHDNTCYLQEKLWFSVYARDSGRKRMPAETWIFAFNLQIRNDSAVMQMLSTSLGENWLTIKSQILPITGNTLSCLGLADR